MGVEIYAVYQRALAYRGAVDFDDLIRLAVEALELDPMLLERLRQRWPYILEDEAQDSSRLQEKILRLLTGPRGNWVRVGDPNQAIYETFTTANPRYLREFMQEPGVTPAELPNSGRSSQSIIDLANGLINWVNQSHPEPALRHALAPPLIQPTPPGDPQPNPPDDPDSIHLYGKELTAEREAENIVRSVERWLEENPDSTAAILVPRNTRGFDISKRLEKAGVEYIELLRSAHETRETAGALGDILAYLADPKNPRWLSRSFEIWRRADQEEEESARRLKRWSRILRNCRRPEDYVWPAAGQDWLEEINLFDQDPEAYQALSAFREIIQRWQEATLLPVDQLILTLAQDLFQEPDDLALAHKLAVVLRRTHLTNPTWRLLELTGELRLIAQNQRRFLGFSQDDLNFDPDAHQGKAVVTTVHKAKGLEWDRVYLVSVNNYDYPSAQPFDRYISEKWFIRDHLDIQAEALAQLEGLINPDAFDGYVEGQASQAARLEYAGERLRLFYVGITRARRELVVTWNNGRKGDNLQALPFEALQGRWEGWMNDTP
jgi:DNA helicase-2/ATP-dependent DNA helicase PcrA